MSYYGRLVVGIRFERQGSGPEGGEFSTLVEKSVECAEYEPRTEMYDKVAKAINTVMSTVEQDELFERFEQLRRTASPERFRAAIHVLEHGSLPDQQLPTEKERS